MSSSAVPLSRDNLSHLPGTVSAPAYDRRGLPGSIVHLGVGGFHRGHQAVYLDTLLREGARDWALCGVGLQNRDAAMRDALSSQDLLYTVVAREGEQEDVRVIGSLTEYLYGPDDAAAVPARLADPRTRIVSMTVTEKGYHCVGRERRLDLSDQEIRSDLSNPRSPRTMPGVLAEALRLRRDAGQAPFTVLSCDNIPENGEVIKRALQTYCEQLDPSLARWIGGEVACPCTMVDRITPVTTDEDRAYLEERIGIRDRWPVFCELFTQWVIEDHFPAGRPHWDRAGATFVSDVKPFELMKIRLLNGTHSAFSYLALLLGHTDVPAAMADPQILGFVRAYMEEVEVTLEPIPGVDYAEYRESLVRRFANPAVADQVLRLAQDGSSKIPLSVLEPLAACLEKGRSVRMMALALAGWLLYVADSGAGRQPALDDPLAVQLLARAEAAQEDPASFLDEPRIFPPEIAASAVLRNELRVHTRGLAAGPRAYLTEVLGG